MEGLVRATAFASLYLSGLLSCGLLSSSLRADDFRAQQFRGRCNTIAAQFKLTNLDLFCGVSEHAKALTHAGFSACMHEFGAVGVKGAFPAKRCLRLLTENHGIERGYFDCFKNLQISVSASDKGAKTERRHWVFETFCSVQESRQGIAHASFLPCLKAATAAPLKNDAELAEWINTCRQPNFLSRFIPKNFTSCSRIVKGWVGETEPSARALCTPPEIAKSVIDRRMTPCLQVAHGLSRGIGPAIAACEKIDLAGLNVKTSGFEACVHNVHHQLGEVRAAIQFCAQPAMRQAMRLPGMSECVERWSLSQVKMDQLSHESLGKHVLNCQADFLASRDAGRAVQDTLKVGASSAVSVPVGTGKAPGNQSIPAAKDALYGPDPEN